jgi:hypothetical protein
LLPNGSGWATNFPFYLKAASLQRNMVKSQGDLHLVLWQLQAIATHQVVASCEEDRFCGIHRSFKPLIDRFRCLSRSTGGRPAVFPSWSEL